MTVYQFVENYDWIPSLGISYHLGVDGLSLPLVFLTTLLFICAVSISMSIKTRVAEYFFWFLILETSVLGVFVSLDLVLFFIFWELELIPMYFIISVWGSGRKEYSAMKFVIYTLFGSAFMLVGLLITGLSVGSFNIQELSQITLTNDNMIISPIYLFLMFFVVVDVLFNFSVTSVGFNTNRPYKVLNTITSIKFHNTKYLIYTRIIKIP